MTELNFIKFYCENLKSTRYTLLNINSLIQEMGSLELKHGSLISKVRAYSVELQLGETN